MKLALNNTPYKNTSMTKYDTSFSPLESTLQNTKMTLHANEYKYLDAFKNYDQSQLDYDISG